MKLPRICLGLYFLKIEKGGISLTLSNSITTKRRLMFVLLGFSIIVSSLIIRVGWLQVVQGTELSLRARENQTRDVKINPQRGIIYDRNENQLAVSVSVETVIANPNEIRPNKKVKPAEIAQTLSEILQIDQNDILKKITRRSFSEIIKRRIEKPISNQVLAAIKEGKLPGITVVDDKKRVYPNNNFAAQILGFTGDDNQGLDGIEKQYNSYLQGAPGRLISATDASGREIPFSNEEYITPQNGNNVYLTIDEVIQHFTEKALETAVINNKVKTGSAIVLDPKTGEILAFAVKPDYDPNTPFKPIDPEIKAKWDTMTTQEKSTELQSMWRNPAISDTYEPGSVFKMITSAAALEEGVVKPSDMFNDIGYVVIAGTKIRCWRADKPHGIQTFEQGVMNSCNPVFIEVAQRMGITKFYNYIKGFGFMEKTGIDLPGETNVSQFHKLSDMGPVELATYSFGQGFQITPLQMVDAIAAVANDGKLLKPHIVKQIKDQNGNIVKNFEPQFVRQVTSKQTDDTLRNILESVVREGTGKNSYVKGYRIAGKTGTSEKLPRGSGKYIASFGAFAPADDPKVAVIVILDEPSGGTYYGGQIAAPVAGQIIDDTLRYMEVAPRYSPEELDDQKQISVPDVRGMTLDQAGKTIKEVGLDYKVEGQGKTIVDQMPVPGFNLTSNAPVFIFLQEGDHLTKRKVPDVKGRTISNATKVLNDAGLSIKIVGSGQAVVQDPPFGTEVSPGTNVRVEFRTEDIND